MYSSRMRTVRCSGRISCHARPRLWTEFLTHAFENITFPQLRLRTVKIRMSTLPDLCNFLTVRLTDHVSLNGYDVRVRYTKDNGKGTSSNLRW